MVASILAWLSIGVFFGLIIFRIIAYRRMPVNLRWDLYPVPHQAAEKRKYGGSYMEEAGWAERPVRQSRAAELQEIAGEVLILKRLREHNQSGLWPWSLAMHWGLYLLVVWIGTLFLGYFLPAARAAAVPLGLISFVLGLLGALGLTLKRATDADLKKYTAPVDYFNLVFLALIFGLGLVSFVSGSGFDSHQAYINNMLTFGNALVSFTAAAMFICLQILLIYMPLSKMIHYLIKHFTFTEILWDDAYKSKGSQLDQKIKRQLDLRPNWSAPHFSGAVRWIDEVSSKPFQDKQ